MWDSCPESNIQVLHIERIVFDELALGFHALKEWLRSTTVSGKIRLTYSVQHNRLKWVIVSFRDKRTAQFDAGKHIKTFAGFERSARLKLDRLDAAIALTDLSSLPGNRFELLKGDRRGQYSIRINDQWRICFTWRKGEPGPSDVEIVDYH